jgi:hypothetical protein
MRKSHRGFSALPSPGVLRWMQSPPALMRAAASSAGGRSVGGLFHSSSALVILDVQRRPVSGQLFHVIIDRAHQLLAVAASAGLPPEDEVAAKSVELGEICFHAFGLRFLIELAHRLFGGRPSRPLGSLPWSCRHRSAARARVKLSIPSRSRRPRATARRGCGQAEDYAALFRCVHETGKTSGKGEYP